LLSPRCPDGRKNCSQCGYGLRWYFLDCWFPMTGKQLKESAIMNSISMSWKLGKSVFEARKQHTDPIQKVVEITRGFAVFKGKIVEIDRQFGAEKTKGFSLGRIKMEGIDQYVGKKAEVDFQNEWLSSVLDGEVLRFPPDLICILDPATEEPIRADIVKYGYRGVIILIPAHPRMRTPKDIQTFGPRYFGRDYDYVPVERLILGK